MGENLENNPFVALFGTLKQAEDFSRSFSKGESTVISDDTLKENLKQGNIQDEINTIAEAIFRITLNRCKSKNTSSTRYFSDVAEPYADNPFINESNLSNIVFEVLMVDAHEPHYAVSHEIDHERSRLGEDLRLEDTEVLSYLYLCYRRYLDQKVAYKTKTSKEVGDFFKKCEETILLNSRTCLQQTEFYQHQDFESQFIHLCLDDTDSHTADQSNQACEFLRLVASEISLHHDEGSLTQALHPVLLEIKSRLLSKNMSVNHRDVESYLKVMTFFTTTPDLARIFLTINTPEPLANFRGSFYESTLLGATLSLSVLPRGQKEEFEFFSNPAFQSKQELRMVETNVWQATEALVAGVHKLLTDLMKTSPEMKHYTLRWLGLCIQANAGRGKLWANNLPTELFVSDAFSVNLTHVLLMFCRPFSSTNSSMLLKIQPSYCLASADADKDMLRRNIHLRGLKDETFLIPGEDTKTVEVDDVFTFITECFFITHKAIKTFFQPIVGRLLTVNRDLHQIQRVYNDIVQQAQGHDETVDSVKKRMEDAMSDYLRRKTALTQPDMLSLMYRFHSSTAAWLCRVATRLDLQSTLKELPPLQFPLTEEVPSVVSCIPELVVENICSFVSHLHRFDDSILESHTESLHELLNFVLVFMSSPKRMKNPHMRAELAEMLASLMPLQQDEMHPEKDVTPQHERERLFLDHPHIDYLPESLLHVFVSIEVTGDSVAFEQKFNYRRPMYKTLKYIWNIPRHRQKIKSLALNAEENIMSAEPPLFLRFINLLVNDAIFLLDEALTYMGQIKEKQIEKDRGDWAKLPQAQRQQEEANFQQISRLAQYHNVMGSSTITTLCMLTEEITSIFCHPTFVDRMANMLNYFLSRLVGPKQKELMVKDKQKFEFKPQETVANISDIYLNLQNSDSFCLAIYQDQRSFTAQLFSQTCEVLQKIGASPQKICDFMSLDDRIKDMESEKLSEDQALAEAPEEFLDPIMGTLMTDPVRLPASNNVVDRNVIARHILSDQTDPFNRQPLSLDQVIPCPELKARIDAWVAERTRKS